MIVNNLNYVVSGNKIIDSVSFSLNPKDKIALVGPNGAGKSTLLKLICGLLKKESGSIKTNNEIVSYLKQEIDYEDYNLTIEEYIKKDTNLAFLEERLDYLQSNLTDDNMNEYSNVLNDYLILDGYNFDTNLKAVMNGLNIKESLDTKIYTLSGGEKMKVLLSALLLKNSDIILLDEPTNNLDLAAIKWLENYLRTCNKEVILISHDEELLNNIANKIFELNNGSLKEYNLKYNEYLKEKELEYEKLQSDYIKAKEQKDKLKKQLQKAKTWANHGYSAKSSDNDKIAFNYSKERTNSGNISKLSKALDNIEVPYFEEKKHIDFTFDFDEEKGSKDIELIDLVCGYSNFKTPEINLFIPYGTKLMISGSNGSGKSTLIKTLIKELEPINGRVILGADIKIGYISQDTIFANDESTIINFLTKDQDNIDISYLFTLLDKFNIDYDDKDKKYNILSPGERTRVNLVKIALNKINVLVLDEITNHLDKDALELIYELINSFKGTIISISHNRKYNSILNADMELDIENGHVKKLTKTL